MACFSANASLPAGACGVHLRVRPWARRTLEGWVYEHGAGLVERGRTRHLANLDTPVWAENVPVIPNPILANRSWTLRRSVIRLE